MKAIWFFVVAGLIFAFYSIPTDPGVKGIQQIVVSKSGNVQEWVDGIAPAFSEFFSGIIKGGGELVTPGPGEAPTGDTPSDSSSGASGETLTTLSTITVANASNVSYDRDEWKHWANNRSCWTVREKVLADEAVAGSLAMEDKDGNVTTDVNNACVILSGQWNDPYSGDTFTNPTDLDVDHMIPLNYTAQHGGQAWDSDRKASYANDLNYAGHLIAVDKSENRSKSDKGPSEWKPSDKSNWCVYAKDWTNISSTWGLSATEADVASLKEMLATCTS
jgi:hypothetical protein